MIDLQELYEWRWKDESNDLVLPYYTRPALDWLQTIDLSKMAVFEFGAGASSIWYADKCQKLYGVESDAEWFKAVAFRLWDKSCIELQPNAYRYPKSIHQWGCPFDIIIVDGIERDACIKEALKCLWPTGYLIVDNWEQPSSDWTPSEETKKLLSEMNCTIFKQEGHPDWQTLVACKQ